MQSSSELPVYLDCNGSTPVEPELLERFQRYLLDPLYLGNCSASHAKKAVEELRLARAWLAAWANGNKDSVNGAQSSKQKERESAQLPGCSEAGIVFCASATEANNMAILGLRGYGEQSGKKHIIVTELEHSSVRKPCEYLSEKYDFELSLGSGSAEWAHKCRRNDFSAAP